jgi:hypothetical protein
LANPGAARPRAHFRAALVELLQVYWPWRLDSGMTEHKFKIGQLVYFHHKGAVRPQFDAVPPGPYKITRRLPAAEDGEFQYEIRNTLEEYNRVARESELTRA